MSDGIVGIVIQLIRHGNWRHTGRRDLEGRMWEVYDIGFTRDEIAAWLADPVPSARLERALQLLIDRGHIKYRRSQKRYIAVGRYRNTIRGGHQ
jgi:hypothetical protein